jgi:hypothetical protein
MTLRPAALFLAIVCTGLITGCADGPYEHRLIQPTTPDGQSCLSKCDLIRSQCEGRQEGREQECGERYVAARSNYDLCVQSGTKDCKAPEPCQGADMGICRTQYEECFTECGGRVERGLANPLRARTADPEAADATSDPGDPP